MLNLMDCCLVRKKRPSLAKGMCMNKCKEWFLPVFTTLNSFEFAVRSLINQLNNILDWRRSSTGSFCLKMSVASAFRICCYFEIRTQQQPFI
jgi:hypothetical protein